MRTLKKVLALSLALAMLFSLTAFAGYTDEEKIDANCVDDVNLMGALNVMTGDTEGTFRPTDTISRAEAAKMIYVIRNGGNDDKAVGWTGMSTFSDVPSGAWYEGYVNYCASLGIIAGVGNGKFSPSGAVTGVELAKMLLVVAGYKPDVQGYTGSGWSTHVIDDAQSAGLFDSYAVAFSASAPRQWAAKLFSNAINRTNMAVYFNGELVTGVVGTLTTVGEKYFNLKTATGYLTSTSKVQADIAGGTSATVLSKTNEYSKLDSVSFKFDAPVALLGQEVKVVYKEGTTAGLSNAEKVYNVYASGKSKVYETTMDAVTVAVSGGAMTVKFDGYNEGKAKAQSDTGIFAFTNYQTPKVVKYNGSTPGSFVANVDNDEFIAAKSVDAVRFVDKDNDGVLDYAFVTRTHYGVVDAYNANKYDFVVSNGAITSGKDESTFANFTFNDTIAKGDTVAITVDVSGGYAQYTVSKLEPVTGKLTTVNSATKGVIGGTTYQIANGGIYDGATIVSGTDLTTLFVSGLLGKEVSIYTDGKYVLATASTAATTLGTNFAYLQKKAANVTDSDGFSLVNKVQVVLMDGTSKVYTYKDQSDTTNFNAFSAITNDNVYEYTLSDGKISFRKTASVTGDKVEYGTSGQALTYSTSTGRLTGTGVTYLTDENTVFFYKNGDEVQTFKASELKGAAGITASSAFAGMTMASNVSGGIKTVVFGVLNSNPGSVGSYAYVIDNAYIDYDEASSSPVTKVKVMLSDGTEQTVVVEGTGVATPVINKIYKTTAMSGDKIKFEDVDPDGSELKLGAIGGKNGNTLSIGGELYSITSDTKVFYVDNTSTDSSKLQDYGDIATAEAGKRNVLFEANDKKELNVLYVEVNGENITGALTNVTSVSAVTVSLDALVANNPMKTPSHSVTGVETAIATSWESKATAAGTFAPHTAANATDNHAYRVTLVLTAKQGYQFAETVTVTLTNYSNIVAVTSNNGNTLTITATLDVGSVS